jgi:hypothetical protein
MGKYTLSLFHFFQSVINAVSKKDPYKLRLLFILILFVRSILFMQNCFAQELNNSELRFLSHLDSLNLTEEKTTYLLFLIHEKKFAENDTFKSILAHDYFLQNDFENSKTFYSSLKNISPKGSQELGYTLLKERKYSDAFFQNNLIQKKQDSVLLIQSRSALFLSDPSNIAARDELKKIIPLNDYNNKKKSPAIAGLYSALIPGSGKLYCGKKSQFTTIFLSNAALGLQTWEAGVKDGTNSARFIISGIIFSFFYIGNIWGSILEARNYTRELNKELENEILDYNLILVSN